MEFRVLGPIEVANGDLIVEVRRGLPRALLAWLALRAPDPVPADLLIERLWGDALPRNPQNALQIQVYNLRRALGRAVPGAELLLVTHAAGYALDVAAEAVDAHRLERLVAGARELAEGDDPTAALGLLDTALALWRGVPLAEISEHPDAVGDVTRLAELRVTAAEARVNALLALGQPSDAASDLASLVAEHPLREGFHAQLMLALYRAGRQAEALRAFEAARQLLAEQLGLEPGPALRDLEARILAHDADLDWRAPPRPAVPPPAASQVGVRRNPGPLPAPVTALVGREAEVAHVAELLDRTRHVTLTGPGGAGKSRLALEVARRAQDRDDVWLVDLADVESALVAATVANELGIPVVGGEDAADAIAAALASTRALLILDTCEPVVHAAAKLVGTVLRRAPGVRVLATSRRPLALAGELAWPVPPLSLPPPGPVTAADLMEHAAVQLFVERARSVRPDFTVTDANAGDVADICLSLDGLPLAIELAAAHADVLAPSSIRARLKDRFSLLVGETIDAAERQRTLRATLDWSAQMLTPEEERFLARLSVFAGSLGLETATEVSNCGADAVPLLRSLARQSLLVVMPDERYRLLDSVRAYAKELLDRTGTAAVERSRHAEFYADLADRADRSVRTDEQERWVGVVRQELANMRAALDWSFSEGDRVVGVRLAASLAWFWAFDGMFAEARQRLEPALATAIEDGRLRARVLLGASLNAVSIGRLVAARDLVAEAVELARQAAPRGVLASALIHLGTCHWALGDHEGAAKAYDEALDRYRTAKHPWAFTLALVMRARTALDAGEISAVFELMSEATPLAEESGDGQLLGLALEQSARAELARGRNREASELAARSLEAHEAVGYREGVAAALHVLGLAAFAAGDLVKARDLQRRLLETSIGIGLAAGVIEALESLAEQLAASGDPSRAARFLAAANAERDRLCLPRRGIDSARIEKLMARVGRVPPPRLDTVIAEALTTQA